MKTFAQTAGLVPGKQYRVKATCERTEFRGKVVTFTVDDGSQNPYFTVPGDRDRCFYVTDVEPVEVAQAEPVAIHVSLNGHSTTIVVQRNLTADEVAAVLKTIGN